jgi:hypothetical protein
MLIAYDILVGKVTRNIALGGSRRGWDDNIEMDFNEMGCGNVDWIYVAQDRNKRRGDFVTTAASLWIS